MIILDKQSRVPLYAQVVASIEESILLNLLEVDDKLPSVRTLSKELSITPNTAQKAFTDLEIRKVTYSVPGSGRFVAKNAKEILLAESIEDIDKLKDVLASLKLHRVSKDKIIEIINEIYN